MKALSWHDLEDALKYQIISEQAHHDICPEPRLMFQAFTECPLDDVKVVILGQDPYHTRGKARGVAFGYHPDYNGPTDSSLANIIAEVGQDFHRASQAHADRTLGCWTKQGVLLLNTKLTVREGFPQSHDKFGWQNEIIDWLQQLDQEQQNKVYMLWGAEAQKMEQYLDVENNLILTASHPCRFSAHISFRGCKHFSKANEYLEKHGREPIKW